MGLVARKRGRNVLGDFGNSLKFVPGFFDVWESKKDPFEP